MDTAVDLQQKEAKKGGKKMSILAVNVGLFDGIGLIFYIIAGIPILWKGRKIFSNEVQFIILLILVFASFHMISNVAEWMWDFTVLDPIEDFTEILECSMWAFFLYSFVQATREREIQTHQDKILHLAKFEAIGNLAGGITHDLRNYMGVILGNLELLELEMKSGLKLTPEQQEFIINAKEALNKANALSDDILNMVKEPKLKFTQVNLSTQLKETIELALSNTKTKVIYHDFKENSMIQADEGQLSRVFQNLIINASQAMAGKGTIDLCMAFHEEKGHLVFGLAPGNYIKIMVRDHGVGISREHVTDIFDPYFTTKSNGTGLGLTVAYSIIRNHRGTIEVESTESVGTSFTVYLPIER